MWSYTQSTQSTQKVQKIQVQKSKKEKKRKMQLTINMYTSYQAINQHFHELMS